MLCKKKFFRFNVYIIFLYFIIIFIKFSTINAEANTYRIKNLQISEPYELNFDKEKIINKAFNEAFKELIHKITLSTDREKLNITNLTSVKELIDSFEIVDEKFVDNKYSANFEVHFDKKKFLKFLEKKNIFSSIPIEKNLFLMPILLDLKKGQIYLFSENPFYLNWNNKNEKYFLLKYILPNEDLEDIGIIQNKINDIENYNFDEIISKYDVNDYAIVIIFKNEKKLRSLSKILLNNQLIILNENFDEVDLENKDSFEIVINNLKIDYENQWKKLNQINTSIKLPLTLSLDTKDYDLIQKFEKNIQELDLVSSHYIDKFSNEMTIYKIIYNSTPDKLISYLKSQGFDLDTSTKIWKIK